MVSIADNAELQRGRTVTESARSPRYVTILENIILIAIVLVIVQSFLEDYSELRNWSWASRRMILYTALVLDVVFSIEFLTRFYFAFIRRRAGHYIRYERGWIDLVASLPLLLFASGPQVAAIIVGGAPIIGLGRSLNLLKIIKAIRIARVLRLLRALKLFRNIKHTDSVVTQKHVGRLASLVVTTFVAVLMLFSLLDVFIDIPGFERSYRERVLASAEQIRAQGLSDAAAEARLQQFADYDEAILVVRESGHARYARYSDAEFSRQFGPSDYTWIASGTVEVFLSLRPISRSQARDSLIYFLIILSMLGVLLFLYAPYFCMTVSDPVYVMSRGITEPGYNLQVKVNGNQPADEVSNLALAYNTEFLALKARQGDSVGQSDLTLDNVRDLFDLPGDIDGI